MSATLRAAAELEAERWCLCEAYYQERDRVDPTCRHDAIAEAIENVAGPLRAELEAAKAELSRMVQPDKHHAVCGQLDVAKAEIERLEEQCELYQENLTETLAAALESHGRAEAAKAEIERLQQEAMHQTTIEIDDGARISLLEGVCREVAAELLEIGDIERSRTGGGARAFDLAARLEAAAGTQAETVPSPAPSEPACGRNRCGTNGASLCAVCTGTEACKETFGFKCCVLPAGHDGHHESRSGSCWPLACIPEPPDASAPRTEPEPHGVTVAEMERIYDEYRAAIDRLEQERDAALAEAEEWKRKHEQLAAELELAAKGGG